MKKNNEQLWSAYLDGELGAGEASEYDAQLSESERRRMEAEMRLESAMADTLRDEKPCPSELWKRIEQDVTRASRRSSRWMRTAAHWGVPAFAAAAGILLAVMLFVPTGPDALPAFLELAAADVSELKQTSEVDANQATVENYLRQAGVDLSLAPDVSKFSHHHMELLGAAEGMYMGRNFVRLKFGCCGKPVEVLITRENSPAAQTIEAAHTNGCYTGDMRKTGGYLIAAIGDAVHAPEVVKVIRIAD